jgi:hypothetical protein
MILVCTHQDCLHRPIDIISPVEEDVNVSFESHYNFYLGSVESEEICRH